MCEWKNSSFGSLSLDFLFSPLKPRIFLLYLNSINSAICCPSDCTAGRQAEIGYSSFCQECLQRFCQLCSYISFFRIHLIRDHAVLDPPAGNKNTMSSLLQVSCCSWQKWLSPPQANLFIRIRPCYKPTCWIKKLFSSSHKIPAFRIRVLLSITGSAKKSQSGSMEKTPKKCKYDYK